MYKRVQIPNITFPVINGNAIYTQYKRLAELALKMQTNGLRVDRRAVNEQHAQATARLQRFKALWNDLTSVSDLGDGQTKAVKAWFWTTKNCPQVSIDKKTKQPKLDTNGALLHYLTEHEDVVVRKAAAALIGYRKAAKALSMLEAYQVDLLHPAWNVAGTKGARWSCSGPNIQQLPSKDVKYNFGDGPEIVAANLKNIIIPRAGHVFVGSDYSALEVYLQTYLAGAMKQLEWIKTGKDLHIENARIFFGDALPPTANKSTHKSHREIGKLAFGMVYNVTDHVATTHKQMKGKMPQIEELDVKEMRKRYFAAHPELLEWQASTIRAIQNDGFIELGLMRRRLYLEASTRGFNQAMNSQCQTLGGDLLNHAVLRYADLLPPGVQLALTWHDSIIADVPDNQELIELAGKLLMQTMSGPFTVNNLEAMFVAEPDVGPNLRDMTALKFNS